LGSRNKTAEIALIVTEDLIRAAQGMLQLHKAGKISKSDSAVNDEKKAGAPNPDSPRGRE